MKKLAFLAVLALVLAFSAGAFALTVSLKEASGTLSKNEGALFEFSAETADSSGAVSFEWDFNDGSGIAATKEPYIAHNYYFQGRSGEKKNFSVKVKATDSAGPAESQPLILTVSKITPKARLKTPAPLASAKSQKNGSVAIEIEVIGLNDPT
ncbi:MAG: PKD domain-containing protein, partial [Candidatus Diapherotrites archaeon]